jgi:hypothetical protein
VFIAGIRHRGLMKRRKLANSTPIRRELGGERTGHPEIRLQYES